MKSIKIRLIKKFKIINLGYDFMGYSLQKEDSYSFHHIIPSRAGGLTEDSNGAILCTHTSHPYIHLIELMDEDIYNAITAELICINTQGYIDMSNLRRINDLLNNFEKEWLDKKNYKGKRMIKEEYLKRYLK